MREQIKRDRLAYARTRGKAEPTAAKIVEDAVNQKGERPGDRAVGAPILTPSTEVDGDIRRALEDAYPGTRLLTEAERRISHESLLRRQQEVVSRVQSSQLKGEAGRAALNEAQRELLDISRIRAATSKRYVLLRTDGGTTTVMQPGTVIAGVQVEEIGFIDEEDAEVEPDAEDADEDDALEEVTFGGTGALAATVRLAGNSGNVHGEGRGAAVDMRASLAWDCGFSSQSAETVAEAAPTLADADRRHGGIRFDVTLDSNPKANKRPGRLQEDARSEAASEPARAAAAPAGCDASATLSVPAQLFGVGRPLASKVERLRAHLEEKLGSRAAFNRVYDYVSREESGEQQSGEREEILAVCTGGMASAARSRHATDATRSARMCSNACI